MGQKVNPKGFRIGVTLKWENNWFLNSNLFFSNFYKNLNIKNLIKVFLLSKSKKSILVNFYIYNINSYKNIIFINFYNMHTNNKKKLFDNYSKENYNKFQNKHLKLNFEKKSSILNNKLSLNRNLNNKLSLLSFFNKKYILSPKKFVFKNDNNKVINYNLKKDSILFFYKKNKLNLLNSNDKYLNNSLDFNKNLLKLNNTFDFDLKISDHTYNNFKIQKHDNINLKFYILHFFYKKFLKFNILNFLEKTSLKKDKFLIKLVILFFNKKLENKFIQFKFKEKNNFMMAIFVNLVKKSVIDNIIYQRLFSNNLLKLKSLITKSNFSLNNLIVEKDLTKYLNYKKQFNNNVNQKLILTNKLNNISFKISNKNLSNSSLIKFNLNNYLVNIKKNKLSGIKIENNLKMKKLKYKNVNFDKNSFKKILNILTKFNTELYFFNIKSLFNFKNLLLDKSLVFNLQKQKTKRYFDIMNKLKKRFNRKWSRIQFLGMDLMNIAQYSLYFKNVKLLAHLISYQLTFLPKNKRQTSFLKYLSKIIFNFKGEFKEIIGLKIQFKGRFNKWKRTKKWIAQAGNLLVQSYNTYIDYSCVKGLVKKGIFSVRIWLQFKKNSKFIIKKNLINFFQYSIFKQKFMNKNKKWIL